ncbi:polymorphic toxin-type HINT domain-containing protein, partial [Frigidibacter sp. SD6-1]|uniref:polymorphic toxin-type HINT domain-containing protein n=2 Tax=Frigidibacter sp. SD6-1 TaxID=3032581 RepID=UPI0024DFF067
MGHVSTALLNGQPIDTQEIATECLLEAIVPSCGCDTPLDEMVGALMQAGSSFPEGTEVLTPSGKVRIEDLREGDLVIARNEETGEVGPYPVAAIMGRQATDLVWLGLEASGQSSRLGVTAEHPLYVEGRGWVQAGELAPGDRIVDADGGVITVVSRELDDRPTLVHNLEVAG